MNAKVTVTPAVTHISDSKKLSDMKPKEQISYLLKTRQAEIAKMLPKHLNAERLLKVAQIAATTTPALIKCDVASLVGAIGQCAQMGLEPNTVLGHAYLVPFNTKRKDAQGKERWVNSVQVIVGYKGLIDLARRSGQIVSIAAHEVCELDQFELVYGLEEKLSHKPALGERGNVIGFYAIAKLKDGGHAFEFMSNHQVQEIMRSSQSKGAYGPWKDHYTEMGRKTVIRRLSKFLPLSIEFQTAVAMDELAEAGKDQNLDTALDGDYSILPDDAPVFEDSADHQIPIKNQNPHELRAEAVKQAETGATYQARYPEEPPVMDPPPEYLEVDHSTGEIMPETKPSSITDVEYEMLRNDLLDCVTVADIAQLLNHCNPVLKADPTAKEMMRNRQNAIKAGA